MVPCYHDVAPELFKYLQGGANKFIADNGAEIEFFKLFTKIVLQRIAVR